MKITLLELRSLVKNGFHPKILTSTGYEKIIDTYLKFGTGVEILFDDKTVLKAADNHLIMKNSEFIPCVKLNVNDIIENKKIKKIKKIKHQEWIDFTIDAEHESYIHDGITHHNSGKSLIIYLIGSWYKHEKKLIIVPTAGLVSQFESDLRDYGFKGDIVTSIGGLSKDNDIEADFVVTTWQALNSGKAKMPKQWYNQFGCVFGDEAHGSSANSVKEILSNMNNCQYRFGTTGTLSDDGLSNATIEGLFGPQYKSISTEEMIKKNYASKLKIKCLVLKYDTDVIQELRAQFNEIDKTAKSKGSQKYAAEIDLITNNPARNKFIKNLVLSLKGNRLVFFKTIEHGKLLLEMLSEEQDHVYHVDGSVSPAKREQIRKDLEENENCILLGSLGTTSTGVNIKRLHSMIAASPSKSKIKVLQSIGRMLRLHAEKEESGAVLYDIVDNLSAGSFNNYALTHFMDRCKIYDSEGFDYTIYNISLKG